MSACLSRAQRDASLDRVRALAALLVVLNHAAETLFALAPEPVATMSVPARLLGFSAFTLGRLGVPLFLMLTGYLLLPRSYEGERLERFYRRNLLPLLLSWELWVVIYNIYIALRDQQAFDFGMYLRNALLLEHVELPHSWYLPMILGVYLFLPFFAEALRSVRARTAVILGAVVYFYFFITPSLNLPRLAADLPRERQLLTQPDFMFSGGVYGLYLLLGYAVSKNRERLQGPKVTILSAAVLLVCFVFTVWCQLRLHAAGYAYNVWYSFAAVPVMSLALFLLLLRVPMSARTGGLWAELSACAYGVYVVHFPILETAERLLGPSAHRSAELIWLTLAVYAVSVLLSAALGRVPCVGKTLFLRK